MKEGNQEVGAWVPESLQNCERGLVKKTAHEHTWTSDKCGVKPRG
jgi:hypothetical protein